MLVPSGIWRSNAPGLPGGAGPTGFDAASRWAASLKIFRFVRTSR
jgi:hypothetical protein